MTAEAEEKQRLLQEIAELKKQVAAMTKKLHFLEAVQEHYARELTHYSEIKTKIHDLFMTVNDRNSAMDCLEYALRLHQHELGDNEHN